MYDEENFLRTPEQLRANGKEFCQTLIDGAIKGIPLFVKYYASFNIISFTNFNLFKHFLIHKIISDKAKRLMPDKFIM